MAAPPHDSPVSAAAAVLAAGGRVLLAEGSGGGECAVVIAAQHLTRKDIIFMTRKAGGPICLVLTAKRCDELGLRPLGAGADDRTAFTVTVEAATGVTTGISAADQAHTISVAADPAQGREALVTPGHIRPVRARAGGVLERPHTAEASVDLVRIAGEYPASVTCPVQREDGDRTHGPELVRYAEAHGLPIVTVEDVLDYRRDNELELVRGRSRHVESGRLGLLTAVEYREPEGGDHFALIKGDVRGSGPVRVLAHGGCRLGELVGDAGCDCRRRLDAALGALAEAETAVLVYVDAGLGIHCADAAAPARVERRVQRVLADLGLDGGLGASV